MSHTSNGIILQTPSGKYVRTYQTQSHVGMRTFVQETPDIHCATVMRVLDRKALRQAEQEFGELTEVEVEVTRDIKVLRVGDQPSLC